ncbi:MAG TPA: metallophosphoesterase family protein, partial [Candidatus Methylomirabilis sp.]|nr:metallophosphoesterase family protein [Candidatus Methylomirabilis sp.]
MGQGSAASGTRYVIGDVHGCLTPLQRLLDKIGPGPADELVFIGDYIDRGPQSREVVELVRELPGRITLLIGNHEKMLLDYLDGKD